ENLALNIANHGFPIEVYNRTAARTQAYMDAHARGKPITAAYSVEDFVNAIERPRRIIVMVQAGRPVDAVLGQLRPFLSPGDAVLDCGNSLFADTERRSREFEGSGIHFFGVGVSGGEEGALKG